LIIEAARSGISHHNQPSFAEVFDGIARLISMAEAVLEAPVEKKP
jgi:hypothetical protein